VERYLDFQEGATWQRTDEIFAKEGVFPIGPDRATIDAALAAAALSKVRAFPIYHIPPP
jgi:hypothetical protein